MIDAETMILVLARALDLSFDKAVVMTINVDGDPYELTMFSVAIIVRNVRTGKTRRILL